MPRTQDFQKQFCDLAQTQFETQLAMINSLSSKTFEGLEKAIALNFNISKTALEQSASVARQLLQATDAKQFFTLSAAQIQPNIASLLAYGRQLSNIAVDMQADLVKATIDKASVIIQEVTPAKAADSADTVAAVRAEEATVAVQVPETIKTISPAAADEAEAAAKKAFHAASAHRASEAAAAKRIAEAAVTKKVAEAAAVENAARLAAKQAAKEAAAAKRAAQLIEVKTEAENSAANIATPAIALTAPETADSQAQPTAATMNKPANKAKPAIKAKAANTSQPKH